MLPLLIGRSLAFCAHPHAAWRCLGVPGRALLLAAYAGTSYAIVLTMLFSL